MASNFLDVEVSDKVLLEWIERAELVDIIDVREDTERFDGYLESAIHIPLREIKERLGFFSGLTGRNVVLYCASGKRSLEAVHYLRGCGFSNVYSLSGGIRHWTSQKHPVTGLSEFTDKQKVRYNRHFILPEVGISGQQKLLRSSVFIVGAGGLGSPAAIYLASAGVGKLGLIDNDRVDLSNLQRQILHSTTSVGELKTDSAKKTLAAVNPEVEVECHTMRLDSSNAVELFQNYDVIIDGSDNFPTRYLINEVCVKLGKPLVYGAVYGFQGQVMTFIPNGPCYQCLYPEPPKDELAPSCSEAGVLGVLPGIIGIFQAMEALKLILGIGASMSKLLNFEAIEGKWREFEVRINPECTVCQKRRFVHGDDRSSQFLAEADEGCGRS